MSRAQITVITASLVVVVWGMLLLVRWQGGAEEKSIDAGQAPWRLLDSSEPFSRPAFPHRFRFPADFGAHGDYRTEWWNLTGSLAADEGRRIGLQLTIVRLGLRAEPPERASQWASSAIYAGIVSVADTEEARPRVERKVSRDALGLAGTESEPRRIWVEEWQLAQSASSGSALDLTMRVRAGDLALQLELLNRKSLVDENGIRGRGARTTPPFHYYIQPRLQVSGVVRTGGNEAAVQGNLSLEHAWGELPLPGGPVAVDRFTLHLGDGRELLLTRTLRTEGGGKASSAGLLVERSGDARVLADTDIELIPEEYWESGRTGARYPVRWSLRIPEHAVQMDLSPYHKEGEGFAWLPYWTGAVRLQSSSSPATHLGDGFVQLTGYASHE